MGSEHVVGSAHEPLTAVVQLADGRLRLVRHPADGRVIAFGDSDAAFAFAVSLEINAGVSAGTVAAPAGEPVHLLERGVTALDLYAAVQEAA